MKRIIVLLTLVCFWSISVFPFYKVEEGWITGEQLARYNNRPIYLHNTNAFILTGDKPVFRFAKDEYLYGTVYMNMIRGNDTVPLYEFDHIKSMYKAGQMKWLLTDKRFPGMEITVELQKLDKDFGACVQIATKNAPSSSQIQLVCGETKKFPGAHLSWTFDVMGNPGLLKWGINDDFATHEVLEIEPSKKSCYKILMTEDKTLACSEASKDYFDVCRAQNDQLVNRLSIDTPDDCLDAVALASVVAVDGTWYPPVFVHGCMQWNRALPGWRTVFGGTMYGWHDRVQQQAQYYIESQVTVSDKTKPKADPGLLLTHQHADSRFYGVGHIERDQTFYDMQSQFFDQLIEEYRWNPDSSFVALLRPALELHLQWLADCFDPDGDGLYESYINTWPTDSQWYNGGGTAEATSYAYKGHQAALDMAMKAGDNEAAERHRAMLRRIEEGFNNLLWLKDRGHSGAYKEQGGYHRVHTDPWLYSIFLPIDAGLTSWLGSIESVYYSEWGLQNDRMPLGGRRVWTSNWVPAAWSVREMWPGDNYHLALSYFQAGFPEEGWDIMKGTFMHSAYGHTVPGNLGADQGGIDFGDCVHPFARTLVSGLFGYWPDYPKGAVVVSPMLPKDWNYASLAVSDFKFDFKATDRGATYRVELAKAADMQFKLPVLSPDIVSLKVNGVSSDFSLEPAPGQSLLTFEVKNSNVAHIEIICNGSIEYTPVRYAVCEVNTDSCVWLKSKKGRIVNVYDPQNIFTKCHYKRNKLNFEIGTKVGYHTVVLEVKEGDLTYFEVWRIQVTDEVQSKNDAYVNMVNESLSGDWQTIDISENFNADVRQIYKQKYLSPRPNTVSVRIGVDGFSPWTFPYWGTTPPEIKLDSVSAMARNGKLNLPQGVSFDWKGFDRNIAFVSLWDNYPDSLVFDMRGHEGESICFLVCGSTNMMQCNIENAEIQINYEDGVSEVLPLIPPRNYWNLCPIDSHATAPGQFSRSYYTSEIDRFCMPEVFPRNIALGTNCRAMILPRRLREGKKLDNITLKCLSQEVVVGLMGISVK